MIDKLTFKNVISTLSIAVFVFALSIENIQGQCNSLGFKAINRTPLQTGTFPFAPRVVADFNADGKPDFGELNSENFIVRLNNGTGVFSNTLVSNIGVAPIEFLTGDLNGDNKTDLVVKYQTNPVTISTFLNDGNGNFSMWNTTTFPFQPSQFGSLRTLEQINGDTRPDLIVGGFYYPLQANGTFSPGFSFSITGIDSVFGDFNGDGKLDVATLNAGSGGYLLTTYLNNGTGGFISNSNMQVPVIELLRAVDVNNDGKSDIIARNQYGATPAKIFTYINNGSGAYSQTEFMLPTAFYSVLSITTGDFNGDGHLDLFLRNYQPNIYGVLYGNGIGAFNLRTSNNMTNVGGASADFDGDGRTDFVATTTSYYFSNASLTFRKNVCSPVFNPKIIDINGDGITDIAMWRASDGRWTISPSPLSAYPTIQTVFWGAGSLGDVPTPGDFDGDGKADIAVWRSNNGGWYIRRSSDNGFEAISWGTNGDKPVQSDYDGDGKIDVAVFRPSIGGWFIRYSSNGQFYGVQFGIAEDKPVPADYDGDGKTDIAVFRPSSRNWYILKSSDGGFLTYQWGESGDKPVPADYDNDGKDDIAVFRPAEGNWYMLSSFNGSLGSIEFGDAEDFLVPGNYENSGIAQVAIYRPSLTRWYFNIGSIFSYSEVGEAGEIPVSNIPRVE